MRNSGGVVVALFFIAGLFLWIHLMHAQTAKPSLISEGNAVPTKTTPHMQPTSVVTPVPPSPTPQIASSPAPTAYSTMTRGQITCDYQIPAAPDEYGTVSLSSNWNNLFLGSNGEAEAQVCVLINGTHPSLLSRDPRRDGSRVDSVSWIALHTTYTFRLLDAYGGDKSDCSGVVLATCQVNSSE